MCRTDSGDSTPRLEAHAQRAAAAYGSAADHYALPSLAFWDRFGTETVSRIGLHVGDSVVDLCCGAGASAIPAARAVGAEGRVLGIDVAAPLLHLARVRAARENLANVTFTQSDATRTGLRAGACDAVICVFGVFFAPDMPAFVAEMRRLLRPGGCLAITTWGPGLFEPASGVFWDAIRDVEPSQFRAFQPWDQITTADDLVHLFARAGVHDGIAQAVPGEHVLGEPDQFWDVVLGTGYRATVDALTARQREAVRERVLGELRLRSVTALPTDVVFGHARR